MKQAIKHEVRVCEYGITKWKDRKLNRTKMSKMRIGNKEFDLTGKTYIMGILNVTPDSFSDGGNFHQAEEALVHAGKMIEEGVHIIDIGGESTRPGYVQISDEEEIARIVPVIRAIKEKYDISISVDTYKANVARAALEAGADMINDIWGLKYDAKMADVIKEYDVPVCIMHNRNKKEYDCFFEDMKADLQESIEIAKKAGIAEDKLILDPGVGFAKTYEMNLECINRLEELHSFGYPLLLGTSRKSVIGLTLDLPVTEREEGTLATTVLAVMKGCQFVRVHNVKSNKRAIQMTQAVLNISKKS